MTNAMVVQHPNFGGDTFKWWQIVEKKLFSGVVTGFNELVSFIESRSVKNLTVILPYSAVHVRHIDSKVVSEKHLSRTLPYVMEPHIANAVDQNEFSHFKTGSKLIYGQAVCKDLMRDVVKGYETSLPSTRIKFTSIQSILLNGGLMPSDKALKVQESLLVESDAQICAVPQQLTMGVLETKEISNEDWVAEALKPSVPGLCKVGFDGPKESAAGWLKVAAVVGLAFASFIGSSLYEAKQNHALAEQINEQTAQTFLGLYPSEGRVFSLERQIKAKIEAEKSGVAGSSLTGPVEVLAFISEAKNALRIDGTVESVEQRNGRLRFTLKSDQDVNSYQLIKYAKDHYDLNLSLENKRQSSSNHLFSFTAEAI